MSQAEKITGARNIAAFITAVSSKKYALAHKYLTSVVSEKLKARINKAASKPLF
jgi:hypothetical protein